MDEQNKGMKDRWAPPTDRGERGYATDRGFTSGEEYGSRPADRDTTGIAGEAPDRRTNEIRGEIDETRDEMRETIDAIQDRLRPGNVASRAAESIRDATVGRVREFAGSLSGHGRSRDRAEDEWRYRSHGWDGSQRNVVLDRIRDNPMAAAIAAGSIAWLIFGSRERGRRQRWSDDDRGRAIYGSTRGGEAFIEERHLDLEADRRGYSRGRNAEWSEAASEARERVADTASTMQRRTRDFASDSPFAAGAIAAAIGLAVGLAIPESERENDMLGETRDSVIERGKDAVRTAAERVQTAAGEVQRVAGDALKGIAPGGSAGQSQTRDSHTNTGPSTAPTGTAPTATGSGSAESAVPGMQAGSGGTGATPTTGSQTGRTRSR